MKAELDQADPGRGVVGVRMLVAFVGVLATLALCTSSALAISQRGHTFAGSFSIPASSGVALSAPSALAVNEATGDVYVLDKGNNRVVRFGPAPAHEFLEAWGFGVANGESKYERCKAGEACEAGIAGTKGEGQLQEPDAIAVDNAVGSPSNGDVYVASNHSRTGAALSKFTATGEVLHSLSADNGEAEGPVDGIAVDPTGVVWVEREYEEEDLQILRFTDEVKNKPLGEEPSEIEVPEEAFEDEGNLAVRPGFAVDAQHNLYVTFAPRGLDAEQLEEEEKELKHKSEPVEPRSRPCTAYKCYVAKIPTTINPVSQEVEEAEPVTPEVGTQSVSGLALDTSTGNESSGNLYLDDLDGVSAFGTDGSLIQEFSSSPLESGGGTGIAVNGATNEVLVANTKNNDLEVYVPTVAGKPGVRRGGTWPADVGANEAQARSTIEPNGSSTHYRVQYGPAACSTSPAECLETSPAAGGSGFGEEAVSVQLTGLAASTTYHFRVIVENGSGLTDGEERTFTTQPSTVEAALADGRAWEQVTPVNKHGATVLAPQQEGGLIEAAEKGNALAFVTLGALGSDAAGERAPEPTENIARRTTGQGANTSWSSEDIAVANEAPAEGLKLGAPWFYEFLEPETLTKSVLTPVSSSVELAEHAPARNIYVRNNDTCATEPSTCFAPLVTPSTVTSASQPEITSATLNVFSATPTLNNIAFGSEEPLTSNALPGKEGITRNYGLYEWGAAQNKLQLISVMPGPGEVAARGELYIGAESHLAEASGVPRQSETAMSNDGSRVLWTRKFTEPGGATALKHLYLSQVSEGQSVASSEIDEANSGVAKPETVPNPEFQTANKDLSQIFFTDYQRLTSNATAPKKGLLGTAEKGAEELYVYEPNKPQGQRITDLSPSLHSYESAAVRGGILGTGEERGPNGELLTASVYFAANGVLAQGAEPGHCAGEEGPNGEWEPYDNNHTCNLYVVRYSGGSGEWGKPELVAILSGEDASDWGDPPIGGEGQQGFGLEKQTARVSPNGRYLAFMSNRRITGYDNEDVSSRRPGERLDEEVYLYSELTGRTVCASCNPSGSRPRGVFDQFGAGEGQGLLVDRTQTSINESNFGADPWLAASLPGYVLNGDQSTLYQSRYLSNSGRLFFNGADPLTHLAVPTRTETVDGVEQQVGVENVYEYEPEGIGSCAAANTEGGCVSLISSGESEHESGFEDASGEGEDVYFITSAKLSTTDTDSAYDIYDARICKVSGSEPCAVPPPPPGPPCTGEECRPALPPVITFGAPATTTAGGTGNVSTTLSKGGVLGEKVTTKSKPVAKPTEAQLLAKALKACKKDKKKAKRLACEKAAHKKYPTKKSAKKSSRAPSISASRKKG